MKRFVQLILICFLVVFWWLPAKAQISFVFLQSNPYSLSLDELIAVNVLNSSGVSFNADIHIELSQEAGVVYSASWTNETLNEGLNEFKRNAGFKEQFSPLARQSALDVSRELSPGAYKVCFRALPKGTREESAVECMNILVESILPLILIFPADQSTLSIQYPEFIWQGPFATNSSYTYSLKVCELFNGQSPGLAIQQNPAIFNQTKLNSTQLAYPFQAKNLEQNHSYVWQVEATSTTGLKSKSEVWVFKYQLDSVQEEKPVFFEGYLIPSLQSKAGWVFIKKELKVSFDEANSLPNLQFDLLSENGQLIRTVDSSWIHTLGFNKFVVNLSQIPEIKTKKRYSLNIQNLQNGDSYLVNFIYYK